MARTPYQFDTNPKKLEPEYPNKKKIAANRQKNKKTNLQKKQEPKKTNKAKTIIYLAVCFGILFTIGYRNTQIDESFVKLQDLKNELALLQKENEQLEISIENSLNLSNIEEVAREQLGMQKLDNKQKIYINLPKRDYVEPATEKVVIEEQNWFQQIIQSIKNIL